MNPLRPKHWSALRTLLCLLIPLLLAAGCEEEKGAEVQTPDPPPISADPDDPNLPETRISGLILDWVSGERIPNATIASNPETKIIRATDQGQFVLEEQILDGVTYEVNAEAEGYASGGGAVVGRASKNTNLDIQLIPAELASELVFLPGGVVLTETQRKATVFLENPSEAALRWELRDDDRPSWLVPSSVRGTVFTGNPEVIDIFAQGSEITGTDPTLETVVFYDQNDRVFLLNVTVFPHDPARLSVQADPQNAETATAGDEVRIGTQVFYDGEPVYGERVECTVNTETSSVDIPVVATTDTDGVAWCTFTPENEGEIDIQVSLAAYPSVTGFSRSITVSP